MVVICGITLLFLFDKSDSLLLLLMVVVWKLSYVVGENWMITFVGGVDFG